jgi:hypothetical protein
MRFWIACLAMLASTITVVAAPIERDQIHVVDGDTVRLLVLSVPQVS